MEQIRQSWQQATPAEKLLFAAQAAMLLVLYYAMISGFADLMGVNFSQSLTQEFVVQCIFLAAVPTAVILALVIGMTAMLDRDRHLSGRLVGGATYVLFAVWSVFLSFGFFWKTVASEDYNRSRFTFATVSILQQVSDVTAELHAVQNSAFEVAEESRYKADIESMPGGGGTCSNNNPSAGASGPRSAARDGIAHDIERATGRLIADWLVPLQREASEIAWRVRALDPALNKYMVAADPASFGEPASKDRDELIRLRSQIANDPQVRKATYDALLLRTNMLIAEANRLQNSVGRETRSRFEKLARDMSEAQGRPDSAWCADLELAALLTSAANQIAALPEPQAIDIQIMEDASAARYATIGLARRTIAGVQGALGLAPLDASIRNPSPDIFGANDISLLGEDGTDALSLVATLILAHLVLTILNRHPEIPYTERIAREESQTSGSAPPPPRRPAPITKVFISYRRADSQHAVDRLYEALNDHLPKGGIFIDVDDIPKGVDYVQHLTDRVNECGVLLAVIGPQWLNQRDETGGRRLDDPKDFVRIEIAAALKRGIPVVPVLLDGAPMPKAHELPDDLRGLERRQAAPLRRESFRADAERLIDDLGIRKATLWPSGRKPRR